MYTCWKNYNSYKHRTFKNCESFTSCISRINNTHVDYAQYIDVVIPMYNLIEYGGKYSKTTSILFHYWRVKPSLANNCNITDFKVILILICLK